MVSKEIWSSSSSLCTWVGASKCGFCMMFMIEVGLERLEAWSRQLLRACKAGSVRLSRCSSVAVALRRCWRLPSVTRTRTHLSIFSHFSLAWTAWICFVLSAQLGLSNSTSCSLSCAQHNKAAQSAYPRPFTRAAPSHTSVYIFDHYDRSTTTSLIYINTRVLRSPFLQLSRLSTIQQPSTCRGTPDCRVADRICRIRPAHILIQQEWSVLMAT